MKFARGVCPASSSQSAKARRCTVLQRLLGDGPQEALAAPDTSEITLAGQWVRRRSLVGNPLGRDCRGGRRLVQTTQQAQAHVLAQPHQAGWPRHPGQHPEPLLPQHPCGRRLVQHSHGAGHAGPAGRGWACPASSPTASTLWMIRHPQQVSQEGECLSLVAPPAGPSPARIGRPRRTGGRPRRARPARTGPPPGQLAPPPPSPLTVLPACRPGHARPAHRRTARCAVVPTCRLLCGSTHPARARRLLEALPGGPQVSGAEGMAAAYPTEPGLQGGAVGGAVGQVESVGEGAPLGPGLTQRRGGHRLLSLSSDKQMSSVLDALYACRRACCRSAAWVPLWISASGGQRARGRGPCFDSNRGLTSPARRANTGSSSPPIRPRSE